MPMLTISKKAMNAGKAWNPGWYKVTFDKLEGPTVATSGKSNNYKGFFTDESGNETIKTYNDSEGLVGELAHLFAACADIPADELADQELDFDKIKGMQLYIEVKNEIYKKNPTDAGRVVNSIVAYQPISAPPF